MAFGDLTRHIAGQALGGQKKKVLDALRPPDLSKISETVGRERPPAAPPAENISGVIFGQIQAMQKALKEDQELVVLVSAPAETLRVLEVFLPSPQVVVLTGIDTEGNITRVVSGVESVQLICKVVKVQADATPHRINFVSAKR
jgi:hypothetical protein